LNKGSEVIAGIVVAVVPFELSLTVTFALTTAAPEGSLTTPVTSRVNYAGGA
jgi:hypothetical protein